MTELWVKKSPTDVHRLIDNKLPPGSKCTGVAMTSLDEGMVEEYVATINGQEVIVQGPAEESADDVAAALVELAPPPPPPPMAKATTDNAAMEGSEITEADEAMGGPVPDEYEYDDSSDENEGWEPDDAAPKAKKTKKKK